MTTATSLIYVSRPWHLKMQVTLYPKNAKSSEEGTIERWQDGDDSRTVFTFGNSSRTTLQRNGKSYGETQGENISDAATATLEAVLHPGPYPTAIAGTSPEIRKKNFGKANLDCIMLSRPMPRVAFAPLGLFPTYCLSDGDHLNVSYNFGSWTVIRNQLGKFADHEIATKLSIMAGEQLLARGDVVELSSFTPKPDEFEPSSELAATAISTSVAGGVMTNSKVSGSAPVYPTSARTNHISGTVVLEALVGTDGRIHELSPVSAPDPDLAISAISAVRDWRYKPYLLNGVPVDVNTTITVNYHLNR